MIVSLLGQCSEQHDILAYTDFHDISEDTRVVSLLNGGFYDGLACGTFSRLVVSDPSTFAGNVASRSIRPSGGITHFTRTPTKSMKIN